MRLGGFGLIGLALLASVQGGRHQTGHRRNEDAVQRDNLVVESDQYVTLNKGGIDSKFNPLVDENAAFTATDPDHRLGLEAFAPNNHQDEIFGYEGELKDGEFTRQRSGLT